MQQNSKNPLQDGVFIWGLIWVSLSSIVFVVSLFANAGNNIFDSIFILNQFFTCTYWLPMIIWVIFAKRTYKSYYIYPALMLGLISCFSANRDIRVFAESETWYSVWIILLSVSVLLTPFYNRFPKYLQYIFTFILGVSLILLTYLSIVLIPFYIFGLVGFWFFGIPFLVFMPFLFFFFIGKWIYKNWKESKIVRIGISSGLGFSLLFLCVYVVFYSLTLKSFNGVQQKEDHLPRWVHIAQRLPHNFFVEKVIKSDWVYSMPLSDNSFRRTIFAENKKHDPLVVVAAYISGETDLNESERIKILRTMYDCRHESADRLWNGNGLKTTEVNTSIQIWPHFRMSYMEQLMQVSHSDSWGNKEAIYTFHLPEGSVVTSLSLWVNGEERKSMLTTVEKADLAYRQIVGVESRDPSLVHWQEGSLVTLRVFPVMPLEERKFKIGITSPLYEEGERLVFRPVYFEGTDFSLTKETIQVNLMGYSGDVKCPSFLKKINDGNYESHHRYRRNWEIEMNRVPVSNETFEFNKSYYSVQPLESFFIPVKIIDVYIDLNAAWTWDEFDSVCTMSAGKNLWIYTLSGMQMITKENSKKLFEDLHSLKFSLFPFYEMQDKNVGLVVSKSAPFSPNFEDLKSSDFICRLKENIKPGEKMMFFNLGTADLSPYLKTMFEYRILQYQQGNLKDLEKILQHDRMQQFGIESDSCIVINRAGISINRNKEGYAGNAPGHLMRLFAYNHLLQRYAKVWDNDSIKPELVAEAQEAYIVSPVSSMIVLETDNDYERFDIKNIEKTLGNASEDTKSVPVDDLDCGIIGMIFVMLLGYGIMLRVKS